LSSLDGVVILDKPAGLVSMRAVEQVKRLARVKRAGHAGTLDPAATGVLPICLGRATRIASLLLGVDKEYVATVRLGLETDTCDLDGQVVRTASVPALTPDDLGPHLDALTGTVRQRPPAFSAVHIDGERAYERARRGEEVEAPEREVIVSELELLGWDPPDLRLRIRCGTGTYVRSLAADLGRRLGCGACLAALRRTRVGALGADRAVTLETLADLAREGRFGEVVIPPAQALAHIPSAVLGPSGLARIRHGQAVGQSDLVGPLPAAAPGAVVCLLDEAGELVALAETTATASLQPRRVLQAE
jgi:tRNA pseudouridine55 synthase